MEQNTVFYVIFKKNLQLWEKYIIILQYDSVECKEWGNPLFHFYVMISVCAD